MENKFQVQVLFTRLFRITLYYYFEFKVQIKASIKTCWSVSMTVLLVEVSSAVSSTRYLKLFLSIFAKLLGRSS